jgi:hypothetical protein
VNTAARAARTPPATEVATPAVELCEDRTARRVLKRRDPVLPHRGHDRVPRRRRRASGASSTPPRLRMRPNREGDNAVRSRSVVALIPMTEKAG